MSNALPSLDHLRAFEAAGRHESFKDAAAELNVTAGAVGQRIRALETQLGILLFERHTRRVVLTEDGLLLLNDVRSGLEKIHNGLTRLKRRRKKKVLKISTTNGFSEMVLMPILTDFAQHHPDCDLRIISTDETLNLLSGEVDLCIRFGRGNYANLNTTRLTQDTYIAVCAPNLLANGASLQTPSELCHLPLIDLHWRTETDNATSWTAWFRAHRLPIPTDARIFTISTEPQAIKAALNGQGIALVNSLFARDEISNGRLVRALPDSFALRAPFNHYLVTRNGEAPELINAFCAWIAEKCKQ